MRLHKDIPQMSGRVSGRALPAVLQQQLRDGLSIGKGNCRRMLNASESPSSGAWVRISLSEICSCSTGAAVTLEVIYPGIMQLIPYFCHFLETSWFELHTVRTAQMERMLHCKTFVQDTCIPIVFLLHSLLRPYEGFLHC